MALPRRVLAATAATAAALAAPVSAHAADPINYVAMGDSWSAGSGILPPDPTITPLCARTTLNFPNLIAKSTGATFKDVSCGGAQTKDYYNAQYPGLTIPQLDALSADTDLVTMTIGGNDGDTFLGAIAACTSAGTATAGYGSPCKDIYGDYFTKKVDTIVGPNVTKALAAVKAKAPNARVAILSYPMILPPKAIPGCFAKMPVATGDVPYLYALQQRMNVRIKEAAAANGVEFVDAAAQSGGHDACQPIGTRWVEPLLFGTNTVPVHPNALGESQMAGITMRQLGL